MKIYLEFLDYDLETGVFTWKKRPSSRAAVGSQAGVIQTLGYRQITLRGQREYAHRLAWYFVYGEMPAMEIDHVNRSRDDNRIANLRLCTHSQNCQNKAGIVGASFDKRREHWVSEIHAKGKKFHLGSFDSKDKARAAYQSAKIVHHDFLWVGA